MKPETTRRGLKFTIDVDFGYTRGQCHRAAKAAERIVRRIDRVTRRGYATPHEKANTQADLSELRNFVERLT
jgi:hypothetical protein